jgi:hypothetical protein
MSVQRPNGHKSKSNQQTLHKQQHLNGTSQNVKATSTSSNDAISTTSPSGVKSEPRDLILNDMHANSKLNELINSNKLLLANINIQQQHGNHATADDVVERATQISPAYHTSLLNYTSNRLSRSKINEQQINALETVFKQKQYLNQLEKEQLSNLLNITPLQV